MIHLIAHTAMFSRSAQRLASTQAIVPQAHRGARVITHSAYNESPTKIISLSKNAESSQPIRNPRSIQAIHLKPLKHEAEYGVPSCDLQLRSFSLQPLEFFSDFALRAAYYLGLPASGPIPLPRITERWTVPRSHFIFKKSQENFERVTLRRMIQIRDGHPETVQLWLAYLRKHQYFGIGMKANIWEFGPAGLSKSVEELSTSDFETTWSHLGQTRDIRTINRAEEILNSRRFQEAAGLRQQPAIDEVSK